MDKKYFKYIFLITVIFIAACIETDIYLPAFSDMMVYFSASEEQIQSLLTWNFLGICLSGPIYGPISDSLGRKGPLFVALGLFLLGSVITVFGQTFGTMLCGRLLQGLGSGGCFTLGTAIIFDAFQSDRAMRAVNSLNATIPLIMALAPLLGGYLNHVFGFRANFIAIVVFVALSLLICCLFYDETLIKEKRVPLQVKKILGDFKTALTSLPFWQLMLILGVMFGGYIAFLSTTAVLFVVEFRVAKQIFPYFQAVVLLAWLLGSLTFNRSFARLGVQKIKKLGTLLFLFGGVGFIVFSFFTPRDPYFLTIGMLFYTFGCNWCMNIYFPESMELLPEIKGTTASLITSVRLLTTSCIVGLISLFYNGTIYPLVIMMIGVVLSMFLLIFFYEKRSPTRSLNTDKITPHF